jgi:hypothetical protein
MSKDKIGFNAEPDPVWKAAKTHKFGKRRKPKDTCFELENSPMRQEVRVTLDVSTAMSKMQIEDLIHTKFMNTDVLVMKIEEEAEIYGNA